MADNIRDRINKAKVIIFNSLDKLDKSGTNHKIYDAKFKAICKLSLDDTWYGKLF